MQENNPPHILETNKRIYLAFYKGIPVNFLQKVRHKIICWFTSSQYSHVEIFTEGKPSWSASTRDCGIRSKEIDFNSGKWDVIDITETGYTDKNTASNVTVWFQTHAGDKYDQLGLLRFVFPFFPKKQNQWFCSEAVAASLGLHQPEIYTPQDLYLMFAKVDNYVR